MTYEWTSWDISNSCFIEIVDTKLEHISLTCNWCGVSLFTGPDYQLADFDWVALLVEHLNSRHLEGFEDGTRARMRKTYEEWLAER